MKIAYGTYAMPDIPLEQTIPLIRSIGYDGVEIYIGDKHENALPADYNSTRRSNIRKILEAQQLGVPALMLVGPKAWEPDADLHARNLETTRETVQLARDFGYREPIVISIGIGGKTEAWDRDKNGIVVRLRDYVELGEKEGIVIAGEAHCGAGVDRSVRALEVIQKVNSPYLRLHFDIVHFYLAGDSIEACVRDLVPVTGHTHITDAQRHADGSFDFRVLGDGELDSTAYMRAMAQAGWDDYITLEVSARIWSQKGFDTVDTARRSYTALSNAFKEAGVPRD